MNKGSGHMGESVTFAAIDRRELLITGSAAMAIAALFGTTGLALAQANTALWQAHLNKITGPAKPSEGKVKIDLPEIAENGNTVPFTVVVDSPMTDKDHVKAVHIISTGNPVPDVASYLFTPLAGKVSVSSRMRLAKTQDIIAVAELSNGSFVMGKRTVKVTIGGCGG